MGICNHYGQLINIGSYEFYHESVLSISDLGVTYEGHPIKDKIFQIGIIELNHRIPLGGVVSNDITKVIDKLMKLKHSSLAKYLDHVLCNEKLYAIIDYCPHGNLQEIIDNHPTLDPKQAQGYCKQLVDGLAYLHSQAIVHGNLKPNTIFLEYESIKMSFYGLYEILKIISHGRKDLDSYIAPENLQSPEVCTMAADIWALGVIMHQILYKVIPVVNDYGEYKLSNLKSGEFSQFDAMIKRCLELNPQKRIKAHELLVII